MNEFLFSITIVSSGIWGVHILFQEDMIFEKQGNLIENRLGKYWSKPVISCPICMSSLWGVIGFFSIRYFFNIDLPMRQIIPFVFCLCGLNTIISKLTSKERVIIDE